MPEEKPTTLVVTLKDGQGIKIGDNIQVFVERSGPGRIKVATTAPRSVAISRIERARE